MRSRYADETDSAVHLHGASGAGSLAIPQIHRFDTVWLSGSDPGSHAILLRALAAGGVTVHWCRNLNEVRDRLRNRECSVLVLDTECEETGASLSDRMLAAILAEQPHMRVIALVRRGEPLSARVLELLRLGLLHDYHTAPIDERRLLHTLGHLHGLVELERKYADCDDLPRAKRGNIIGNSPAMRDVHDQIRRVARVDTPVLITGESGTGKELVAQTIHQCSKHRDGKFVSINCAALPPHLVASELFGHEAGAFTGALRQKKGLIEDANHGTLFLDEIGDMQIELQPHFLRFLEDGTFKRVGGTTSLRYRMRIVAATNVELGEAIRQKSFREDLYYRLNVLTIHVPPLRERPEDIEPLAEHYLQKFRKEYERPKVRFSARATAALTRYEWPGNVRELVNAISRAVVMTRGNVIQPDDLNLGKNDTNGVCHGEQSLAEAREDFDRKFIMAHLARNQNNIQKTARELGVSRVGLYRLLRRYDIQKPDGETDDEA